MAIETVADAARALERAGMRVLRATVHEPEGDRQVWFVGLNGWVHLRDDAALIAAAQATPHPPLVHEGAGGLMREWPEAGG
ncbi:hypothetical protein [Methylobacterium sp. R2-1]|uniref:hypothetical protein n=1 Tax=Methylobacterium sp. R2-1 TaxID=2587064 RepID=UPI00160A2F45|nr:hypothetical protein [Methylobacterium sp. R2-1]MBB2959887.1 hypothetical protein [Methylobacterium sp. R2-1]